MAAFVQGRPGFGAVAIGRVSVAAAQHGADTKLRNFAKVFEVCGLGLRHLADFFVERHLRDDGLGLGIVLEVVDARLFCAGGLGRKQRGGQGRQEARTDRGDVSNRLHFRIAVALPARIGENAV